jgi:preprotein translocase subunit SecD
LGKRHLLIFMFTFLLIGIFGLTFGSQVLADLKTLYQNPADVFRAELVLSPKSTSQAGRPPVEGITLAAARQVVDQRLDSLHLAGTYQVMPQGNQLLVKLPQSENMPYIASVLASVGEIEFIDGGAVSPPINQMVTTSAWPNPNQGIYQTLFTGREIRSVASPDTATGQIFYQLTLEPAVTERLGDFIDQSPSDYICMVMDGHVLNCSLMYHWSGTTLEILPSLSSGTAISLSDLAIFLASGPLPAPFEVEIR